MVRRVKRRSLSRVSMIIITGLVGYAENCSLTGSSTTRFGLTSTVKAEFRCFHRTSKHVESMTSAHVCYDARARKFLCFRDDAFTLFSLFCRHRARAGVARCGNPVSETPRSEVVSRRAGVVEVAGDDAGAMSTRPP